MVIFHGYARVDSDHHPNPSKICEKSAGSHPRRKKSSMSGSWRWQGVVPTHMTKTYKNPMSGKSSG